MDPTQVLAVMRAASAAIEAASAIGANVSKLTEAVEQARSEGRTLTDAELDSFASDAQEAIDRL